MIHLFLSNLMIFFYQYFHSKNTYEPSAFTTIILVVVPFYFELHLNLKTSLLFHPVNLFIFIVWMMESNQKLILSFVNSFYQLGN